MTFPGADASRAEVDAWLAANPRPPGQMTRTATFGPGAAHSPYRYTLGRRWAGGPTVTWVMLNPSTADAYEDDPTIRRCIGFSKAWAFGALEVVNLFAWRATDPRELLTAAEPVGESNDAAIIRSATSASRVVCAWGQHKAIGQRAERVLELLRKWSTAERVCLGRTAAGMPRHPLYVRGDVVPEVMP